MLPAPQRAQRGAVYLGDITEVRGVGTAIGAIAIGKTRPELTLIGRCVPEVRRRLDALAAEGRATVSYTGYLPLDQALPLVAAHAVAVTPVHDLLNYRNSFPAKMLDYLALGVPVVASALPGAQRLLGDAAGVVWVEPGDAVELAGGINLVVTSTGIRAQAAAAAAEVRAAFRWPAEDACAFYLASA